MNYFLTDCFAPVTPPKYGDLCLRVYLKTTDEIRLGFRPRHITDVVNPGIFSLVESAAVARFYSEVLHRPVPVTRAPVSTDKYPFNGTVREEDRLILARGRTLEEMQQQHAEGKLLWYVLEVMFSRY